MSRLRITVNVEFEGELNHYQLAELLKRSAEDTGFYVGKAVGDAVEEFALQEHETQVTPVGFDDVEVEVIEG